MHKNHQFLIRDADGKVWLVQAEDKEAAYKAFGVQILGMADTKDFDTGNVDVDLVDLTNMDSTHIVTDPFDKPL